MSIMTPPPHNFREDIRSAIAETLGLSTADLVPQLLNLRVVLDATTTSATDEIRIDGGFTFMCWEVRAHIAMNALASEKTNASSGSWLNQQSVTERELYKAYNTRIELYNPDRDAMKYTETDVQPSSGGSVVSLSLSSLLPAAGGQSLKFCDGNDIMPLIVNEGDRIKMKATLLATPNALYEGATEYGVVLIGAYVRNRTT